MFVKQSKSGKKTYSGLCIDLLNKLQEEMKFRYTIEESPGNVYGAPDVFTGEWSGMVRYLIDNVSVTLFLLTFYYKVCSPKERKSRLLNKCHCSFSACCEPYRSHMTEPLISFDIFLQTL